MDEWANTITIWVCLTIWKWGIPASHGNFFMGKWWLNPLDEMGYAIFRQIHLWAEHSFCLVRLMGHGMAFLSWHSCSLAQYATNTGTLWCHTCEKKESWWILLTFQYFSPQKTEAAEAFARRSRPERSWAPGRWAILVRFSQVQVERWCSSSTVLSLWQTSV